MYMYMYVTDGATCMFVHVHVHVRHIILTELCFVHYVCVCVCVYVCAGDMHTVYIDKSKVRILVRGHSKVDFCTHNITIK